MTGHLLEFPMNRHGDPRSDIDLAEVAVRGDQAAFTVLIRRHHGVVRGLLRRLTTADQDLADDLAQIVFLTAWRRIDTYRGGAFRSWLCTIAYRTFLQHRRTEARSPELAGDEELESAPTLAATPGAKLDLDRAMAMLPDAQRVAVALCVAAGMSHVEVSRATGWPLGTVKSHVNRGKAALRDFLSAYAVA